MYRSIKIAVFFIGTAVLYGLVDNQFTFRFGEPLLTLAAAVLLVIINEVNAS